MSSESMAAEWRGKTAREMPDEQQQQITVVSVEGTPGGRDYVVTLRRSSDGKTIRLRLPTPGSFYDKAAWDCGFNEVWLNFATNYHYD